MARKDTWRKTLRPLPNLWERCFFPLDIVTQVELLSNLVFESFWSCGDLAFWGSFNSVFERDACDDFGKVVKAA